MTLLILRDVESEYFHIRTSACNWPLSLRSRHRKRLVLEAVRVVLMLRGTSLNAASVLSTISALVSSVELPKFRSALALRLSMNEPSLCQLRSVCIVVLQSGGQERKEKEKQPGGAVNTVVYLYVQRAFKVFIFLFFF
jgi:hypothetical protein